ncbi:f19ae6cc-9fe1-468f-811c-82ebdd7d3647 [Thermothielavioides terrestris]|uniref:F19ae6cc-9fe1-468f-811c-82ebdd7d3647 n=1 Tax=Thermothielavioides terrestris TaxID=2587410 RepID=A0A446BFL4_9PEZI|nr:f19ae6cc-9fe1-468f-811c-82ebdd7d3647 [Thermothielavioides terrestris]
MEKFSQFRDRGSGISPFLPVTTPSSLPATAFHAVLFLLRLPFFLCLTTAYFLVLQHLPLPAVARKLLLWLQLAIPGVWWVDLQLDGVKRGSLSQQPRSRVPHPGSVIAANFTSPVDALYLAAVFDPIFVACHPTSRKVRRISLLAAILAALSPAAQLLPASAREWEHQQQQQQQQQQAAASDLTTLAALQARHPGRVIALFPECGTTNGRGVLPASAALLGAARGAPVFPVSLRYAPPDVATPVPGWRAAAAFLWKLLGRPTHCVRVRIAEAVFNTAGAANGVSEEAAAPAVAAETRAGGGDGDGGDDALTAEEQRLLDRVAEALARLGRAKRVGLTLQDKKAFVAAWTKKR